MPDRILAILLLLVLAAPASAQDDGPDPEPPVPAPTPAPPAPPPAGFDAEDYARRLVAEAERLLAAEDFAGALGYLRHVRATFGGTIYVRQNAAAIDLAMGRAEDGQGAKLLASAAEVAAKNPAAAKQRLAKLRADLGSSRFFAEKRAEIEALETRVRTALWGGKAAWRGAAELPAEGVLRLAYTFERVEELGDLDPGDRTAPRIQDERLVAGKLGGVIRHRLAVPEGATAVAEVQARGHGRIALLLEGDGPDVPEGALELDVESTPKTFKIALRRGKATLAEAEDPQLASLPATTPWTVRLERRDGKTRAATVRGDGAPGVPIEAPATASAAAAGRPGIAFLAGKVEIDGLRVTAPLPDPADAVAQGEPAKSPLPKGVWIPLAKAGLDAFKAKGSWTFKSGVLSTDTMGSIASKELEGREVERYAFTVEVNVDDPEAGARRRKRVEPFLTIVVPVGEKRVSWVFSGRDMEIPGVEGARHGSVLPLDEWVTLTVKVGSQGLEAFVGAKPVIAVPLAKLESAGGRAEKLDSLAFIATSPRRKIQVREPKIRLE